MAERPLFPVSRVHLDELGGEYGIWQRARGSRPDESFGYRTDDVGRALEVDLLHGRALGWTAVRASAERSLAFLEAAFNPTTGRFRNLRAADGTWQEATGSEECHGRALHALASLHSAGAHHDLAPRAGSLFLQALPTAKRLTSQRAIASIVLACADALSSGLNGETQSTLEDLGFGLARAFARVKNDNEWPWPEESLTCENALLPRALIAAGSVLGDYGVRRLGLRALDWLIAAETAPDGSFAPIGSEGWTRGGNRGRFDQQPIEATATILASLSAYQMTADERYLQAADRAYGWFLGDNDARVALADPGRGACRDGLSAAGVSLDEGAESTLMWLMALEEMRAIRSSGMSAPEA